MDLNELIKILFGVLLLLTITYCLLVFNKKPCNLPPKRRTVKPQEPQGLESQYVCNQFSSCDTTGFMNFKHY